MEEENQDPSQLKRYFIIQFTGLTVDREQQRGKIHMFTTGGCFVNEEFIQKTIRADFNLTDSYISGIVELSEEDFADFIAPMKGYNQTEIQKSANEVKKIEPPIDEGNDMDNNMDEYL